jgi:hypothetical protein
MENARKENSTALMPAMNLQLVTLSKMNKAMKDTTIDTKSDFGGHQNAVLYNTSFCVSKSALKRDGQIGC